MVVLMLQYPDAELMVAYGEFRAPYAKDPEDSRFVFYGIRYIVENYIGVPWTEQDVELADKFYATHNAGFAPFPFPKGQSRTWDASVGAHGSLLDRNLFSPRFCIDIIVCSRSVPEVRARK